MNMMDLFKSCLGKIRNIRKGFTLTEILIALAVIAIIVVLVLPVVTSRAQNKSFALAYDAEVREIMNSLEGLTLNENVKSFNDTMMNVSTQIAPGPDVENDASQALAEVSEQRSGAFLKKYSKVAKYCGNTPGTCFAQAYFRYNGRRRGNFDFANIVTGNEKATYSVRGNKNGLRYDNMACALLKNGMSLCISPQVTATNGDVLRPVRGFIDLNGPKEPNVLGRDLRSFSMDLSTRQIASVETADVVNAEVPVTCEDKYRTHDLTENDPCCATLIAAHGWTHDTLQFCCDEKTAGKDENDACCQRLGDNAPARCKSDDEKTACEKYEDGDATQLEACCSASDDEYWIKHNWDAQCCDLNDTFKTQCCNKNETYRKNNIIDCCPLRDYKDPECNPCSAANWTDDCCKTVDSNTKLWKDNCCSKDKYANDKACCDKTQDGMNVKGVFNKACCVKGAKSKSKECCDADWEDVCCQVISSDDERKDNKKWKSNCCSNPTFADKEYCCKDDVGTAGDGTKKRICCSDKKTYNSEHTCCKDFGIGCPEANCKNDIDGYFNKNLTECCPGASAADFTSHDCCKAFPDNEKCCNNGKNGMGELTPRCCDLSSNNTVKAECCNSGIYGQDYCCTEGIKDLQSKYKCSVACTKNTIYLKGKTKGLSGGGCTISLVENTYWLESAEPVDKNVSFYFNYIKEYYDHGGSSAGYEYVTNASSSVLTIPAGQTKSNYINLKENYCKGSSNPVTSCVEPSYISKCNSGEYFRIFGLALESKNLFGKELECYPIDPGSNTGCLGVSVATTMDATEWCCNYWGENALSGSSKASLKKACCAYPTIKEMWESCGGNVTDDCADYASDRTNPKWTKLECCKKDEYYNDESCCSDNKNGKGETTLDCCKANHPSINDSEHECCAVEYDSMGCCSAESSDDDCCKYAIETKGEELTPNHICCSSDKYKNDLRCMTPCKKVENGIASDADKKACCNEKGNAYWASNNWAQTCCLNVLDNQGYYAYRGDEQCCPYLKDNSGLLTCYGPSRPGQCCPSLNKNACTGKGISSSDECWGSCYKADGSPDTSKGVVCCSIWNNDGKLNDSAKSLCCDYPEFNSAHSDVCEDTPETCTPYSYSLQNALEQVSEDCCKKWVVNGGATTPFELALKESVDMGPSIIPQVAKACCQYQSFRDIGEFNKLCDGKDPTPQEACNFNSITFTLTCGPDGPVNPDRCGNNTTYRCSVTDNRPKDCPTVFQYANLKMQITHQVYDSTKPPLQACYSNESICYRSSTVEGLALGRNKSVLLTPGVYYIFDTKCRFVSQTGSDTYIATESLSPSADCPSGACNYVTSPAPSAPNQTCNFIEPNNWFGTERGGGTFSCSHTYNKINGQWR